MNFIWPNQRVQKLGLVRTESEKDGFNAVTEIPG
jgi:hypothetical protein